MEGNVGNGFKFLRQKSKNPFWEDLATTLLRIFECNRRSTIFESLAAVKEAGSVEDFIHEFKILVSCKSNMQNKNLPL